eukprot:CAMPEP_0170871732 /NCGR_PEP_ID=MMETSP0734-20130129/26069_1 /TAXON_ID=186038 /ORGANISM="Fragilariopsis kerguelensis, Strain L26-C5" /LENGTH=37 /DNA_ID= /DNA_START= /DNA_END= /DNA_ORIENTATION=
MIDVRTGIEGETDHNVAFCDVAPEQQVTQEMMLLDPA